MTGKFYQQSPQLPNQYETDYALRSWLQWILPAGMLAEIESDLRELGERVVGDIMEMGLDAQSNLPRLVNFDPWGRRIDRLQLAHGWQQLHDVAAEQGLVAIGYERNYGPWSRIYQFAKLYLFHPSSAIYTCPLAMTDGAARLIEVHGDNYLRQGAYRHLTSRDPKEFWTSGQWMTERPGGSDVSNTETIARVEADGYRLYGDKWFTSATDAQMAMTLARQEDASGNYASGSRGLSLFYLETCDRDGGSNQLVIHRLKDKLGTRALPTAEISLQGTSARLVGAPGKGVKNIATLFNITRIYNNCCAVGYMRRSIALARDYAQRRRAFGKLLSQHPLHLETIAALEVEFVGALHLCFYLCQLLGLEECGQATPEQRALLRLLTPLGKLYSGKQAIAVASEALECFGGAGYVEDTGLPSLLRDSQVLAIWEGTTNILSLDVLRAITREAAMEPFFVEVQQRLERIANRQLQPQIAKINQALAAIREYLEKSVAEDRDFLEAGSRYFSYSLVRVLIASLLLEHAAWGLERNQRLPELEIVKRWCRHDLAPLIYNNRHYRNETRTLALGEIDC